MQKQKTKKHKKTKQNGGRPVPPSGTSGFGRRLAIRVINWQK